MGLLPLWRRRVAVLLALTPGVLLTPAFASAQIAAPSPAEASKASMADGEKAAKNKDWKSAIASFDAANKAQPSEQALDSLANAYYQAGDVSGAWSAYNEWTDKYASKASATKKRIAETRLKELTDKTGGVVINVSEPGAIVLVDDKQVGTSPLASQLRLTAGPHHVKVTKDGFIAFDQSPTVASGTTMTIEAKLLAANAKQKITVTEKGNHPVHVFIDGVDKGAAPWTGEVDPGQHEVVVKGAAFASPAQQVNVTRDQPAQVDLVAAATSAPVKISTDDLKGSIYIDGQLVAQGTFSGELAGGAHEIKITREGFDTLTQTIQVEGRDPITKTYSLTLTQKVQTEQIQEEADRPHGIYGGFGILGFATPGGTGSTIEQQCDAKSQIPTLTSCSTPDGLGAGLGGYIGYHWDIAGIELYGAGDYDVRKDTENWASAVATGSTANPARTEDYTIRRYGAMGLLRVRLTKQWKHLRLSLPVGAGVSWRDMKLTREARATVGGARDVFAADAVSYTSPTIEIEPTIAWRLTPGVAVTLALEVFLESPASFLDGRDNPVTEGSQKHKLGAYGLSTPPYTLAENAQVFIGPVIGMMFGP